ncbi:MAG TPA: DUF4390 domain-containing protein [Steroidobacteraceae bacterium]|nr:DUF4390 domain-containing protein [Steroidobacteraceae bacterium]
MRYSPHAAAFSAPYLARRALLLLLCVFATVGPPAAGAAESRLALRDVAIAVDESVYELDARLDLDLPGAARKAVESGLTLRLTYEIVIDRTRRYMLDAEVASLAQRYEVNYHALSQRWLLRNLNTGEQSDFGSLDMALARISELRGLPILDTALLPPGPTYEGRIRAVLDLSTAPDAFGWLLFWADDWSATSDWQTWKLGP